MNVDEGAGSGSSEEVPQGSVFGNLPGSRPGVRSPRRKGSGAERSGEEEAPDPEPATATAAREEPPPEPALGAAATDRDAEQAGEPARGIEDVAWAGIAAAAEAATVGVRIANRAFEALRDAVERR